MSVAELTPADYNPRTIGERAKQGLSNSIDKFGLVQPIIWNKRTGNVVGGHQRLNDLLAKSVEYTDVVVVNITKSKEKALNVALNHKNLQGEFLEDELIALTEGIDVNTLEELNLDSIVGLDEWPDDMVEDSTPIQEPNGMIKVTLPPESMFVMDELKESIQILVDQHYGDKSITIK